MDVPATRPETELEAPDGFLISHDTFGKLALSYAPLDAFEAPYMFRDARHFYQTIDSPLGKRLLRESTRKTKMQILDVWQLGVRHVTLRDHPAQTPAEFATVKLRVPPGAMSVASARALGAQPTTMAIEDVWTALQTGIIDAQENALATIRHREFDEVCQYLVLTGHKMGTIVPVMSDSLWQLVTPGNQELILRAFREGRDVNDRELAADERKLIAEFQARGMRVIRPDVRPFRRRAKRIWRRYAGVWGDSLAPMIQRIGDMSR